MLGRHQYQLASFHPPGRELRQKVHAQYVDISQRRGNDHLEVAGFHSADLQTRDGAGARRSVAFAGFADSLSTRYRATTTQAFAEAAHRFALSAGALEPFISMAHVQLRVGKGQESGGGAALALGGASMRTSFATAGLRGDTRLQWGASSLTLRASAGWQHAFGDQLPVVGAVLGGQRFHVTGLPIARDTLVSEIGLEAAVGSNMRINLGYSGALSPASQNHAARAGLLWQF
ncbi:autotransporter outer membrane beta-barrel domain-containing protein [Sphingobium fuliginis]